MLRGTGRAQGDVDLRTRGTSTAAALLALLVLVASSIAAPVTTRAALAAPTILAPLDGAVVPADAPLAWSAVDGATGYRVELADDATFDRVWYSADTVTTTVEPQWYFTPGIQHWRVAAMDGSEVGAWQPGSFTVERLDVPTLTGPPDGATFTYPSPGPVLSWTPSLYGPYEIRLVAPSGTTSGSTSEATKAEIPWATETGTWTWSVRPQGNAGSMPWSAERTFVVTWPDDDPVISSPAAGASVEVEVLDWEPIPGASAYDLQESGEPDFPSGSRLDTVLSATRLDLGVTDQTETRWWRVRGRNGPLVGPWSAPRSLEHLAWAEVPTDLWPPDGTLEGAPSLRWSPVSRAVSYQLELTGDPDGFDDTPVKCTSEVNAETLAAGSAYSCGALTALADGDVYWRVRGRTYNGASTPWSAVAHFTYAPDDAPTLSEPTLATPVGPADCDDLDTCPRSAQMPMLSWQPVTGAGFYRVQVDRRDAHLPGQTWDTTGTTFVVPWDVTEELDVERFSWQVVACATAATCPEWTDPGPAVRHFAIGDPMLQAAPADGADASGEILFTAGMVVPNPPPVGEPWDLFQTRALWLQLDDEPTFDAPRSFDGSIDARGQAVGGLPAGTIHWRVGAGDPTAMHGTISRSLTWSFGSSVAAPPDGTTADSPTEVIWDPVQGAAAYELETERDGWHPAHDGGATVWTNGLVGEAFVPGTLDWRVTPRDTAGHLGSPVGGTVEILPKDPVLITPVDGSSVPETGAVFDWDPVDSPVSYRIQVSTTPDFTSLVDDTWSQRTRYVATKTYPLTTLYWRIQAQSSYGQIQGEVVGSSAPRMMTMTAGVGDVTPPKVSAMSRRFVANTALSAGRAMLRVGWTASDPGGSLKRYRVARSVDAGPWTLASLQVSGTYLDQLVTPGHTYRYRITAIDAAGNPSNPLTGPTITVSRYQENSSRVSYSGTWSTSKSSVFSGGASRKSTRAGAKASITLTGRSVAWVARKGPDRGKAEVYVNGTKVATVDLKASSYQSQRVVWAGAWSTSASRKVTVRVLGTKGRPRVDIDAFVTAN